MDLCKLLESTIHPICGTLQDCGKPVFCHHCYTQNFSHRTLSPFSSGFGTKFGCYFSSPERQVLIDVDRAF